MSNNEKPPSSETQTKWSDILEKLDAHSDTSDLERLRNDFSTVFQVWLTKDEQTALLKLLDLPRERPVKYQVNDVDGASLQHRLWTDGGRFCNLDEWRAVQHYKLKTDLIRYGFISICAGCLLVIGLLYLQAFGLIKSDTPFAKSLASFIEILRTAIGS